MRDSMACSSFHCKQQWALGSQTQLEGFPLPLALWQRERERVSWVSPLSGQSRLAVTEHGSQTGPVAPRVDADWCSAPAGDVRKVRTGGIQSNLATSS
jgi:hypothetical protein